jgi:diguanylate cyclase (GGDEF)-like protein
MNQFKPWDNSEKNDSDAGNWLATEEFTHWRVLSVDDDSDFQDSIQFALMDAEVLGKPIHLERVGSFAEASTLLAKRNDFAVVLVDVVMETEDAGLRLINAVRDILGVTETRFILLTGQPGRAPIDRVMQEYDLSDYCLKSDLMHRGLVNILTGAIRNYHNLMTLAVARKGLQLIIESSSRLQGMRKLQDIAIATLEEIAKLIHVPNEGLVCVKQTKDLSIAANGQSRGPITIGACGRLSGFVNKTVYELPVEPIKEAVLQSIEQRRNISSDEFQVLYFPESASLAEFAVYVETKRQLSDTEKGLLQVFAANASKGFGNVALVSKLDKVAYEDELLHIPNRSALLREIGLYRKLGNARHSQLVLLDLDGFSVLNNLFGSGFGNQVLEAVAKRLLKHFSPYNMVARLQSDVFAIVGSNDDVSVGKVRALFKDNFEIDQSFHHLGACFTEISLSNSSYSPADLVRAGLAALRCAKMMGPNSVFDYSPEVERLAVKRYETLSALENAISHDQLEVHFQPVISLDTGGIYGAEALIRWPTDEGYIPPDEFIPLAEESSHIHGIGERVTHRVVQALCQLKALKLDHFVVSINLSARQLESANAVETLIEVMQASKVDMRRVALEVTETSVMKSFSKAKTVLSQFREVGGLVSIDDFGTGLSSLAYLFELPADHLKIDRMFVRDLETSQQSRAMAQVIIELARRVGMTVVAEGVETASQIEWLKAHGCQYAQGWYYARAMPLDEFVEWSKRFQKSDS